MYAAWILAFAIGGDADTTIRDFVLHDATGKKHTASEWSGKKAVVLFLLGTDCPVSNFYCPQYVRLSKTFAENGVLFLGIHPDPDVSESDATKHAAEYQLPFSVLLDPAQVVARQTKVKVVPECVVLSPQGKILYRGRIDDRFALDGKKRDEPTTRDLEQALNAILAGKEPPVKTTEAFGCPLPPPKSNKQAERNKT